MQHHDRITEPDFEGNVKRGAKLQWPSRNPPAALALIALMLLTPGRWL